MTQTQDRRKAGPRNTNPTAALMSAAQAANEIYGVSERTFHEMRKKGLVPIPVVLGPRMLRWVRSECEAGAMTLPRQQQPADEPAQLRRRRIEAINQGACDE